MGVTIHFEGKLKSNKDFDSVIEIAKNFAKRNDMDFLIFKESNKLLQRVKNEEDFDYIGSTRGIKIQPDLNSDPLWIEFDNENYIQEYCKTQFANISIHIKIIELLEKIKPHFIDLIVIDEGEYWNTKNKTLLKKHLDDCFIAIDNAKNKNPNLSGPYKVSDGRIADLMENQR